MYMLDNRLYKRFYTKVNLKFKAKNFGTRKCDKVGMCF